jgi:two-component system sensor histidine kinase HupT/HoxJ
MHPAMLLAMLSFGATAVMAVYVATRANKSVFQWLLLALLGGILLWTSGSLLRFSTSSVSTLRAALDLIFSGILLASTLWLVVSAHYTRSHIALRPTAWLLVFAPPAVLFLALLTNDGHRLVLRKISFASLEAGPAAFAGPLFWVFMAWAWGCVAMGSALYVSWAQRMVARDERWRGLTCVAAALVPGLTSLVYVFQIVPLSFDLTPAALTATMALLSVAIFRYQLLESLPLARRDVVVHLDDGLVISDRAGLVTDVNPAAQRILGAPAVGLRGRPLAGILDALAPEAGHEMSHPARGALQRGLGDVLEVRTVDQRLVELGRSAVCDGAGEPVGHLLLLRDRTEERRCERLVRQTQKLETVGALAAGIAHEVNDPLAFVHANLAQIERLGERVQEVLDGPDAELARELADLRPIAEETLAGVERIARIVADMRRLSVERVPSRDCVDLREVVDDARRLARLDAHSSPPLEISLEGDLPKVSGSAERLVQIVLNLIENARQALASTPDGRIRVEARVDGSSVEIAVEDNGPGIPESARERVFDPFFTTKGPDAGMGLGLAIAFDIAREHAGVLEERGRPGGGARFVLRLPVPDDPAARTGGQVEADRGDGQVGAVDRAVPVEVEARDVESERDGAL